MVNEQEQDSGSHPGAKRRVAGDESQLVQARKTYEKALGADSLSEGRADSRADFGPERERGRVRVHLRLFPELVPDGADADAARRLPAEVEQRSQGARK